MIPPDLLDPSVGKTLTLIHDALERRFKGNWARKGNAWDYHEGKPFQSDLKPRQFGVWLNFDSLAPNERESPFTADYIISNWSVVLIFPDEGLDRQGFSMMTVLTLVSDLYTVLRETQSDMGMDGTVDYSSPPMVYHDQLRLEGDTSTLGSITMTFKLHHPLQPIRFPN